MTTEPRILRSELPPGLPTLNANDRTHHMARAKRTQLIRAEAYKAVKAQSFMPMAKVRIRCIYRAPDNRKRDVVNLYPSFKAAIDGIVDSGLIRDDNDFVVKEVSFVRGENLPKKGQLVVQVIECE